MVFLKSQGLTGHLQDGWDLPSCQECFFVASGGLSLSWIAGEEQRLQCPGGEWGIGTTDLCGQDHGSMGKQEFAYQW